MSDQPPVLVATPDPEPQPIGAGVVFLEMYGASSPVSYEWASTELMQVCGYSTATVPANSAATRWWSA